MIHYDTSNLQLIESEIINTYNTNGTDYSQSEDLLDIRRKLLNDQALLGESQEDLLPHIIAFNDALRNALKQMYSHAHELYSKISITDFDVKIEAKCFLARIYPSLHPHQGEDRQDLFDALCDAGWNQLYDDGVSFPLVLPRDLDQSFDSFIGMDCPLPNWNEHLDKELTKDLHIINAFHNLFDHTKFALTDFIFCRDFDFEYNISYEKTNEQYRR